VSRTASRRRRDLAAITVDGVGFSLMVGAGETYVPAFALALGLGEVMAGWIVSLPVLAGAVLQLASPTAIRWLRSHRRWVVLCAVIQAGSLLAYLGFALAGRAPAWGLLAVATIYWGAGLGTGPAWNTWVGTLVPRPIRARFFARRGRLAQAAVLAGFAGAGASLQLSTSFGREMLCFAALFLVTAASRGISAAALWTQDEPRPLPPEHRRVPVREWIGRVRHGRDGRLLFYLLAVQLAVQIAGPFFTPYMLGQIGFSYWQFLALLTTSFSAKMLALPLLGRLAHRYGPLPLLYVAGVGIVPLSGLWMLSDQLPFLLVVQLISGPIWAAYELTTFLLLFDHIDETERTSVLTTYNLANALAMVVGALLGGAILKWMQADRAAYLAIFGISSAARAVTVILLARLHPRPLAWVPFVPRIMGVRPNAGTIDAPMVTMLGEAEPIAASAADGASGADGAPGDGGAPA
jgi:MFS family permease